MIWLVYAALATLALWIVAGLIDEYGDRTQEPETWPTVVTPPPLPSPVRPELPRARSARGDAAGAQVLKQPVEDVAAADLIYGRALAHIESPTGDVPKPWAMQVDALALRIAAQLPLYDDAPQSPLEQAEDAKRRRDLDGELTALIRGGAALESAPWHPARPGDLVHVHYEAVGQTAAFGETYLVAAGSTDGFLNMQLLAHTLPENTEFLDGMVGCFAVDDDPDPLMELWMEAGPHRLTVVRDGRPVHVGGAR